MRSINPRFTYLLTYWPDPRVGRQQYNVVIIIIIIIIIIQFL